MSNGLLVSAHRFDLSITSSSADGHEADQLGHITRRKSTSLAQLHSSHVAPDSLNLSAIPPSFVLFPLPIHNGSKPSHLQQRAARQAPPLPLDRLPPPLPFLPPLFPHPRRSAIPLLPHRSPPARTPALSRTRHLQDRAEAGLEKGSRGGSGRMGGVGRGGEEGD